MLSGLLAATPREVRFAKAEDAAGCASLHAACFAQGWSSLDFEQFLTDRAVMGHVLAARGPRRRIDGFVLSRMALDEAEILSVAIAPALRGRGLALQLLRPHMEALDSAGIRRLFLEVAADNAPAIALYARCGFATVGSRRAYYRRADGAPADALVMACERLR